MAFTHKLLCTESIGTFESGNTYNAYIFRMSGRKYEPGKNEEGKWLDEAGQPDIRLQVFDHMNNLKTFDDIQHLQKHFTESL